MKPTGRGLLLQVIIGFCKLTQCSKLCQAVMTSEMLQKLFAVSRERRWFALTATDFNQREESQKIFSDPTLVSPHFSNIEGTADLPCRKVAPFFYEKKSCFAERSNRRKRSAFYCGSYSAREEAERNLWAEG